MIVVVAKYLIPKGYLAMTVFPFVILRDESDKTNSVLLNHEHIHLRQQAEMLVVPFFIWYLIEYLIRLLITRNHDRAYRNISFEREAYAHEADLDYISRRKLFRFLRYFK